MILSADGLELKTKKQLIEILRTEIKFDTDTDTGTILKAPLYAIYLVYKFFGSLLPKHLSK